MPDNDLFPTWESLTQEGLLAITDNGGETFDRYSVVFRDGDVLGLSGNPENPQGFSQWSGEGVGASEVWGWLDSEALIWPRIESVVHRTEKEVPEWMRDHILSRINEAYRDHFDESIADNIEDTRADIIDQCFTYAPLDE